MRAHVDPTDFDFTEQAYTEDPNMHALFGAYDPGRAYVLDATLGLIDTPKRLPPRNDPEALEVPDELWYGVPLPGSIEEFVHPYGVDLKGYVEWVIERMGPCHS